MAKTRFTKRVRSLGDVSGLTIPKRVMDAYDIEEGDYVDVEIKKI